MSDERNEETGYEGPALDGIIRDRTYKPGVLAAMRRYARAKPWRGSVEDRKGKMRSALAELATVYERRPPALEFQHIAEDYEPGATGFSTYDPTTKTITICGGLSVLTLLHEFAHFLHGRNRRIALIWSVNLFRRAFPRSFERLVPGPGGMLVKPAEAV